MAKILIIGCGDLGTAIANNLQENHQVIGLRLSNKASHANIQVIQADVTQPNSLSAIKNLNPNIIIYCVSAGGATDAQYQAAYVLGLKNVLNTQSQNTALQHVFFVSSTRVYGQITDDLLDENTRAEPADFGGVRLLEAENVLQTLACKATSMRLSGIYGNGRLYLANMAKDVSKWPQENNWSNRIHLADAAGFITFLVQNSAQNLPIENCYIVTDDLPTAQYSVLTWLAKQQGIDASQVIAPAVTGGKRLSNIRLRDTGFELQYPNYKVGYGAVLKKIDVT